MISKNEKAQNRRNVVEKSMIIKKVKVRESRILFMDDEPNTIKNRLIRLLTTWDMMIKYYHFKNEQDILKHIINVVFRDKGVIAK